MQIGCQLDKVAALCAIVDRLAQCIKKETAKEKQRCALSDAIQPMIMGEGPDTGDMGLFDDYRMCCLRGSTDDISYTNHTCMRLFNTTGLRAHSLGAGGTSTGGA